jgi:hypothetical protein
VESYDDNEIPLAYALPRAHTHARARRGMENYADKFKKETWTFFKYEVAVLPLLFSD